MAIVDLIIRLKDSASSGIGRIGGALSGLSGKAGDAATKTQGLAGAITQGVLQANAITFAIGKANEAVGFLNGKFEEAKNLQLEQINAATTFAALTGQSSDQASRFIEKLNDSLAKSAATLPGATQDYKQLAIAVQDNVLDAFKDPSGTLNQAGFEKTLISMSESFGALTAASTRDIGNTSLGLSKALGGASVSELRQIAFFEQNPVILNEIEKRLKSMGKEMKDLNIKERVQLIEEVGKKFITEDFKKQASESVDGLLQSFTSYLFDPGAGIFGIMRDLDPATEGVQSAFKSMNEALIEVIGPSGVFFQVSDIFSAAGVQLPDPMRVLKGSIDFFVGGLKQVNQGLTYIKDFVKAGGSLTDSVRLATTVFGMGFDLGAIKGQVIGFFTSTGDRIGEFLGNVSRLAAPLFNRGVGIVSQFFADPANFYEIGVAFGGMIGKAAGAVIGFLGSVDYPQLLVMVGRVAISLLAAVGGAIGGVALGALPGIQSLLVNTGVATLDGIKMIIQATGQTIVDGLTVLGNLAKATVGKIPGLGPIISGVIDTQLGALQALVSNGFGGLIRYLSEALQNAINAGKQALVNVVNQARNIPVIGNLIPQASPPAAMAVGSRYSGNIGWAAGGFLGELLGAAQQEISRMPGGAQLLVANSSETILPQGMLGNLLNALIPQPSPAPQRLETLLNSASPQPPAPAQGMLSSLVSALVPQIQAILPSQVSSFLGAALPSGLETLLATTPQPLPPQGMLSSLVGALVPQLESILPPQVGSLLGAVAPLPQVPPAVTPAIAPAPIPIATPTPVSGARTVTGNTFNFPISIPNGTTDPGAIVQMVIEQIQQQFEAEMGAQLG